MSALIKRLSIFQSLLIKETSLVSILLLPRQPVILFNYTGQMVPSSSSIILTLDDIKDIAHALNTSPHQNEQLNNNNFLTCEVGFLGEFYGEPPWPGRFRVFVYRSAGELAIQITIIRPWAELPQVLKHVPLSVSLKNNNNQAPITVRDLANLVVGLKSEGLILLASRNQGLARLFASVLLLDIASITSSGPNTAIETIPLFGSNIPSGAALLQLSPIIDLPDDGQGILTTRSITTNSPILFTDMPELFINELSISYVITKTLILVSPTNIDTLPEPLIRYSKKTPTHIVSISQS